MEIRLRNTRRGPIIGVDLVPAADGMLRNIGTQTRFVPGGEIGIFDGDSRAVQIYAKGGVLEPVDRPSKNWFKNIDAPPVVEE